MLASLGSFKVTSAQAAAKPHNFSCYFSLENYTVAGTRGGLQDRLYGLCLYSLLSMQIDLCLTVKFYPCSCLSNSSDCVREKSVYSDISACYAAWRKDRRELSSNTEMRGNVWGKIKNLLYIVVLYSIIKIMQLSRNPLVAWTNCYKIQKSVRLFQIMSHEAFFFALQCLVHDTYWTFKML